MVVVKGVGDCAQEAVGSIQLAVDSGQYAVGSCQLPAANCLLLVIFVIVIKLVVRVSLEKFILMTPQITTLHQLLDYDAARFYSAEVQLEKSLNEWVKLPVSHKLRDTIQKYLGFVQEHIQKLDQFINEEQILKLELSNRVMKAFIEETKEKLSTCADPEVKDACLLSSIQGINHFKISAYGTAAAFANTLAMRKQAGVFHDAEVNEKQIDDRLTQLAEYEVNAKAKAPVLLK